MKTSARNQLQGTVSSVAIGAVNTEVHIDLPGGTAVVATITKESAEKLGVTKGLVVLALVKAPHIVLVTDFAGYRLSARNQLPGVITAVKRGSVNSEIDLQLTGGENLAATITNDSADELALAVGMSATAVFKAGSVILAVAV